MSLGKPTLTFIETISAMCGAVAASMVAFGVPQPYFWFAFPLYVAAAITGVIVLYNKKCFSMMSLLIYYIFIDSYGVYNWWPW